MRLRFGLPVIPLVMLLGFGASASGQSCVGLACQQQVCSGNATTSITGTVYAPNGTDPLPNVTVYIPNDVVPAFPAGVSCPVVGAPEPGSPLVGAITDVNGNFTLIDVPVGSNIPLVIVSGRWRRQLVIPGITACVANPQPSNFAVMPSDHTQGDIPRIAIATGSADGVECVLRKMGIKDSEFTDPTGSGRINLFAGGPASSSGSVIGPSTPTQASLMGNASTLNQYDVLMLPCEGGNILKPAQELANLVGFANSGGRVYASHFSYSWMYQNPPFNTVANWIGGNASLPDGTATVNVGFTAGQTLAQWLALPVINASVSPGQMQISTLRHDVNGVNPPTQSWITLNTGTAGDANPVMQFVWDTPIAAKNQCGRVLFNEYHVESTAGNPSINFPGECNSAAMNPQEKLLEYMLFELTDEGGQPSLAPLTQNFGLEAIGYPSAAQTFTWTNNSSFTAQVTAAVASGDFNVTSNNCGSVAGGSSCTITVVFTPTALGARTGTLSVASTGSTITASLTGTGTPGFSIAPTSLSFGSLDVGNSASQNLTLTSLAGGPLPVPLFATTGQYAVSTSACGATVAAGATCQVKVTFLPTSTGPQNGTIGVNSSSLLYSGLNVTMTGNGIDFTITLDPTSGTVIAGDPTSTTATLTPLAGFAAPLTLTCTVGGAAASTCGAAAATVTPTSTLTDVISMTTTSQYTVIGYGVGGGYLWVIAVGSGLLLWWTRRRAGAIVRSGLMVVLLAAIGISATGCSGRVPTQNSVYTGPGGYTITVTATDGFLVHSATYKLTVKAK